MIEDAFADKLATVSWVQNIKNLILSDERIGWPDNLPNLEELHHGWFRPGNAEVLKRFSSDEKNCIIELGSWLGMSTKFILENNPNATVFAVDIWSNEHFQTDTHYNNDSKIFADILKSHPIYDQFLVNMKKYKFDQSTSHELKSLIPMKMDSCEALQCLHQAGISPNLIYVDANHHYDYVVKDVEMCLKLFPNAILIGDDWDNNDVKGAVQFVMQKYGQEVYVRGNTCWTFAKARIEKIFEDEQILELERNRQKRRLLEIKTRNFSDQLEVYKKKTKL